MSAVIAITNQKGGVGKTTTSCALLAGLHQMGRRVLGVDLDPQGSLGFCLGLDIDNCATVYDVMKGARSIKEVVVPSECGDILPSNILLSAAELESKLGDLKKDLFQLRLQHATNQLDNPIKISEVKRDIARVKTIIREQQLAGR